MSKRVTECSDGNDVNEMRNVAHNGSDDLISSFIAATREDWNSWEQTHLLPCYIENVIVDVFIKYRLKLMFLEARLECFRRRGQNTTYSNVMLSAEDSEKKIRRTIRQQTEAAIERLADVAVLCWVEEDIHREIDAFCIDTLNAAGGTMLRNIVRELVAESFCGG
ncbi:uncharacterized protein TM35_000331170 [Trypanosoma theileri]|uniref:Uncharacterized protein n=1 Tax=Trypanosoma theileri TaxID=67003 RepID=A0A1X0NND7_9TRYP|nr:uncharacterized protein TM35_000331170 [Trypanosoma theileri]ORC85660.1 hypothetical protein TM35_000331170 [Trypanosoma theileri]